uniref:ADAM metallopeptidase domain 23a n=1 Tax=Astatotilapia calliptera TaxID=8154 RepID=A0AAX7TRL4_ASTCA
QGGEHCYYHGQVRGNDNSHACTHPGCVSQFTIKTPTDVYKVRPVVILQIIHLKLPGHCCFVLQMPRSVFEEMKYLEVMIVSDHSMVRKNLSFFPHLMLCGWYFIMDKRILFNIPDLEQLHTRVVLVAVEIWTDRDHIPISVKPLELLRDFSKYRQQSIKHHADSVQLLSNATFHYRRSSTAYFGGMCSVSRGVGVNEYATTSSMVVSLSQSLAQNLGIQWDPASKRKECGCTSQWAGCIMEDTGVQHPQKFSKCSISDYKEFLLKGGGSCLFNRPTKLFEAANCGNGFVELGEECDCGLRTECCKKCSLANGAHCSDGPCCNKTCLFYPRGYSCRYAVNDCDISETCSGDSGQCPPNLHKQDGYICQVNQGRCYSGECKTRENQCKYIWGSKAGGSEKFCYEKLNTEGTEKGNCGKDGEKWIQCSKHDVFCGFLLCTNVGRVPRIGSMKGDSTPTSFNHQGNVIQCTGAHVLLDDETDLGYVEDGTPCGPSMMCLDRKCLPIQSLNMSTCPIGPNGHVCSGHGVSICTSKEAHCISNSNKSLKLKGNMQLAILYSGVNTNWKLGKTSTLLWKCQIPLIPVSQTCFI